MNNTVFTPITLFLPIHACNMPINIYSVLPILKPKLTVFSLLYSSTFYCRQYKIRNSNFLVVLSTETCKNTLNKEILYKSVDIFSSTLAPKQQKHKIHMSVYSIWDT